MAIDKPVSISYKFNEPEIMKDIEAYINKTYEEHYAQGEYQATEIIADAGHALGFCVGNIIKYAQRYGKKDGFNKKDLMKVIHYTIILMSEQHYKDV